MPKQEHSGVLCISLDFEKYWGLHDLVDIKARAQDFIKVSASVDRLLDLFNRYGIHCTWATVGLLNHSDLNTLLTANSDAHVPYNNQTYNPFPLEKHQLSTVDQQSFTAKKEIEKIISAKHQELASHTYSHFYSLESGQTTADFQHDLDQFKQTIPVPVESIVFPRNQVKTEYLNLCHQAGIKTYRGNQDNRFWHNSDFESESFFKKMGRTLDAYIRLTADNFTDWTALQATTELINIPASRFLKPYHLPKPIESLKVNRIKAQMTRAAKLNKIYHLWWHPHNFSRHTDENFVQLERILDHFKTLQNRYQFESLNMSEIYQRIAKD